MDKIIQGALITFALIGGLVAIAKMLAVNTIKKVCLNRFCGVEGELKDLKKNSNEYRTMQQVMEKDIQQIKTDIHDMKADAVELRKEIKEEIKILSARIDRMSDKIDTALSFVKKRGSNDEN